MKKGFCSHIHPVVESKIKNIGSNVHLYHFST
jgi:hypothetical protein